MNQTFTAAHAKMDDPPEGLMEKEENESPLDKETRLSGDEHLKRHADEGYTTKPAVKMRLPLNFFWKVGFRSEQRQEWLEKNKFRYYSFHALKLIFTTLVQPLVLLMDLAKALAMRDLRCPTEEELLPCRHELRSTNRLYQSCIEFCCPKPPHET